MADSPTTGVIDLTSSSDEADTPAHITPDRPSKRSRSSHRLEARCVATSDCNDKINTNSEVKGKDEPQEYEAENINGYFDIDQVLDRRTRRFKGREVVEYFVSWKIPSDYTGDETYFNPSWLIAENLNQHSLSQAFLKFPVDADKITDNVLPESNSGNLKTPDDFTLHDEDFSDDEDASEDEYVEDNGSDEMQEFDLEGSGKTIEKVKDSGLSLLENSDYDAPGTVELVLNRCTYRVGQSFYSGPDQNFIYTISMIQPITKKAKCLKYMRIINTFVCPEEGQENSFILTNEEFVLDLSLLKTPCKTAFKIFDMRYDQDDETQRAFAYYNETGKILHHPNGRPDVLDLFAGAGGMSLGLEKYFNVKWVVDNDHMAAATLRANKANSDMQIYTEDVKTFLKRSYQGNKCYPVAGEVDHVHASPPCKGFSRANRNGGKNDMINNKQTLLFIKAIKHFRPKTASFENVPGLVLEDFKAYLQSVVANLLRMDYQVRVKVLSSEKYGDPQRRRRLILLAARNDCKLPDMPEPTHGPNLLPIMTCGDALQQFEKETPTNSTCCGAILINQTVVYNHIMPKQKGSSDDYELIEDEPSRTILARGRPHLHYSGERFISVREAACLQSFPTTYRFFGSLANQYSQVGNAVPIRLSTAISRSVATVHGCPV